MKIVRLTAENVKKLRTVAIEPDGSVVQITGPNGSGKSSVLDAIYYALAGTKDIPSHPVRKGEKKALIQLDLGEIVVTRRFTDAGTTTLTVEASNGARFPSPQRMLDDLLGALTFDPLAFSRMDPKKQLEQLRGVVKIDADIDALDVATRADYDLRTEANRTAKSLRAQAEAIAIDPNAPADPIDTDALLTAMQSAADDNATLEIRRGRRQQKSEEARRHREAIAAHQQRVKELEAELAAFRERIAAATEAAEAIEKQVADAAPLPAPIDVSAIRQQIEHAQAINQAVANRKRRAAIEGDAEAQEMLAAGLTAAIERRAAERAAAIAAAAMPVAGLSFGDGEVLYNGLPFDQASSAEQLRVSVAIAMAANPKLRVMRIKDGSLLDESGLRTIAEMADAQDFQVWIEQVDTTGRVGIVMEDGAIRGAELPEAA